MMIKASRRWRRRWSWCVAAVIVVAHHAIAERHRAPLHVPIVPWDVDHSGTPCLSAREIVERNDSPVVLRGDVLRQHWRAFDLWSPPYLLETLGPEFLLRRVFWGVNQTIFFYQDDGRAGSVRRPYAEVDLPLEDFLLRLRRPDRHGFLYFSTPLQLLKPLLADIQPVEVLSTSADKSVKLLRQIWMGSVGVTTQMHYDMDFNFHVQIAGRKRFLLVPPTAVEHMQLFPCTHPFDRRSQLDFQSTAPTAEWEQARAVLQLPGAMEVTLEAGDALYLPPFWFHHVTNIDAGISVNVWTEAVDAKKYIHALLDAVPELVDAGASGLTTADLFAFYRDLLCRTIAAVIDAEVHEFARQHWSTRYRRLPTDPAHVPVDCAILRPRSLDTHLDEWTNRAIAAARDVQHRQGAIFPIIFGNFVDMAAFRAVNKQLSLVGTFMATCVR